MNLVIGLAAGLFGGLAGLGGGAIMIPLMVGLLKMEQHKAHGTSLVALVFTGLAGMTAYQKNGSVDLAAALILAFSAVFLARLGAKFAMAMPAWQLKRAFGGLLCFVTLMLLVKTVALTAIFAPEAAARAGILLGTGVITGFLSGLLGVGGGSLMVPSMVLLAGFDQYTAQGTALLAMIPIGVVGAYTHWRNNLVSKITLPLLIPAIVVGSWTGGYLANLLPELPLRLIFAVVLLCTGLKYLREAKPGTDPEKNSIRKRGQNFP